MYIEYFKGHIFSNIFRHNDESIVFLSEDGTIFQMTNHNDKELYLADVEGDLNDLVGTQILQAECYTNSGDKPTWFWTFYKLATIKGYVTLRWSGRMYDLSYSSEVAINQLNLFCKYVYIEDQLYTMSTFRDYFQEFSDRLEIVMPPQDELFWREYYNTYIKKDSILSFKEYIDAMVMANKPKLYFEERLIHKVNNISKDLETISIEIYGVSKDVPLKSVGFKYFVKFN